MNPFPAVPEDAEGRLKGGTRLMEIRKKWPGGQDAPEELAVTEYQIERQQISFKSPYLVRSAGPSRRDVFQRWRNLRAPTQ